MISPLQSPLLTKSLYVATAVFVVIGLALQLAPSIGPLEASPAIEPTPGPSSPPHFETGSTASGADSATGISGSSFPGSEAAVLPGEFQAVIVSNIFSPNRAPPRARYRPRRSGEVEASPPPPAPTAQSGPRLFGVTLRASGAVALIEADPAVPGAEIYRIGDPIGGGVLVEIGVASVTIERGGVRRVIRLETEPRGRDR